MPNQAHLLLIRLKPRSKANLFHGMYKTEHFIEGEKYELIVEFENVGETNFPGGECEIEARPPTVGQKVVFRSWVPEIKKGESWKLKERFVSDVLSPGFTLFFVNHLKEMNGKPVRLLDASGRPLHKEFSAASFFGKSRVEIYTYYAALISAVSLIILVFLSVLQLIF